MDVPDKRDASLVKIAQERSPETADVLQNDTPLFSPLFTVWRDRAASPSVTTLAPHSHRPGIPQTGAACAGNCLYGIAFIFIAPATLFRNHDLTDSGIFGYPSFAGLDCVFN
jgi:hypothetical protein